jgi:hypothetical protein
MTTRLAFIIALTASLSGCMTVSNLDGGTQLSANSKNTIFVMGVEPDFRTAYSEGYGKDGKWYRDSSIASGNLYPVNGYIIANVASSNKTHPYGITQVLPTGVGGKVYRPCVGTDVFAFSAPAGKVIYVGDLRFTEDSHKLHIAFDWNPERARNFLQAHYPSLAGKLEEHRAAIYPDNNMPCDSLTISVPHFTTAK